MTDEQLEKWMSKISLLSELEKAILAGCILEEVDPTYENLKAFIDQLTDGAKEELEARLEEAT